MIPQKVKLPHSCYWSAGVPGAMGVLGAWAVFIKALAVRLAYKTHLGLVVSK